MNSEYGILLDQLTAIRKIRRKILDEINASLDGINSRDFYVLYKLCRESKEPTMSELSDSTGLSNALITSSIDSLEKMKLVNRKRGPDRRIYVVMLTEKGAEKCLEMKELRNRKINSLFGSMSREDFQELKETLGKLNDLLSKQVVQ